MSYDQRTGRCPSCGQQVPLYRRRIATHGWPTCPGTGQPPDDE